MKYLIATMTLSIVTWAINIWAFMHGGNFFGIYPNPTLCVTGSIFITFALGPAWLLFKEERALKAQ